MNEISEREFTCGLRHRMFPRRFHPRARVRHFSLDLAHGTGSAIQIDPDTSRSLVILLHGLGDDSTYPLWHWMEALVQAKHSVFSIDWDGHGCAGDSLLSYPSLARSLDQVIAQIISQLSPDRIQLIGHSTGALIGALYRELEMIRAQAPRIQRYGFVSPALALQPRDCWWRELKHVLNPKFLSRSVVPATRIYGFPGVLPAVGAFRRDSFPIRLLDRSAGTAIEQLIGFLDSWSPQLGSGNPGPEAFVYIGELDSIVDAERSLPRIERLFGQPKIQAYPGFGHALAISRELARQLTLDFV